MKKLCVVTPRFGEQVMGGAERAIRKIVYSLARNHEVTVLTSTSLNVHNFEPECKEGEETVDGVKILRFNFDFELKKIADILRKISVRYLVLVEEEKLFLQNFGYSESLLTYLEQKAEDFDLILATPYLFGNSVFCAINHPHKTVMIPCLHDEVFAEFELVKLAFKMAKGCIFYSEPEAALAKKLYGIKDYVVAGIPVFQQALRMPSKDISAIYENPYIIYVGRKDHAKGLGLLVTHFAEFKQFFRTSLRLVLVGPKRQKMAIDFHNIEKAEELDDVSDQEKEKLVRGALALVQPSQLESFSLVIMESWMQMTPVIVNSFSSVTKNFVQASNGGFVVSSFLEFSQALNLLLQSKELYTYLGQSGFSFVERNFEEKLILSKFEAALEKFF
jgi:glycosyltransferase involved in cell wall biosynthesis